MIKRNLTVSRTIMFGLLLCLIAVSLCGCGNKTKKYGIESLNDEQKRTLGGTDSIDEAVAEGMREVGANSFEVVGYGNYEKNYVGEYVDVVVDAKDRVLIARMLLKDNDAEWVTEDIRNAENHHLYYDRSGNSISDVYDYDTDEVVKSGENPQELLDKMKEATDTPENILYEVRSHVSNNYEDSVVDDVAVNDDVHDKKGRVVLVNLTWNRNNSEATTKDMLSRYSDDLAAHLNDSFSSVNEVAVFWTVPYLNDKTFKYQYSRTDNGMALTDSASI